MFLLVQRFTIFTTECAFTIQKVLVLQFHEYGKGHARATQYPPQWNLCCYRLPNVPSLAHLQWILVSSKQHLIALVLLPNVMQFRV